MAVKPIPQRKTESEETGRLSTLAFGRALPAVAIGTAALLLLYLTRAAEQTRDSLVYAYAARTGTELFHPHHLLYTPAIRLFMQVLQGWCAGCDAILAGQVHNILWSAAWIAAFYLIVRRIWSPVALPAALLLLVLRGTWELSTQTTMYTPSGAILTLIAAALILHQPEGQSRWRTPLLAALFAAAVLYHQSNVLFALPLGFYLVSADRKAGWKTLLVVLGLSGGAVLAVYSLVYLATHSAWSLAGFIQFCLTYTSEICLGGQCKASPEDWGSLTNLSPTGLSQLLQSLVWNAIVLPEGFEWILAPLYGLALLALAFWHLRQMMRDAAEARLRGFGLIWIFIYTAFFFWWLPSYQHPFVVTLPPILLLAVLGLRDAAAWIRPLSSPYPAAGLLLGAAILAGGRNFQARILPLHLSAGDSYREAAELDALVPQECVILTSYGTWNNLRYYFDRENAVQAKHPMSYFYSREPLPEQYQLADDSCVYVAKTFLLPTFVHNDYANGGLDGLRAPTEWLAYISWLFDLEYDQQVAVSSREFSAVHLSEGETYLSILPTKQPVDGVEGLFQRLDETLGEPSRPFQTWLSSSWVKPLMELLAAVKGGCWAKVERVRFRYNGHQAVAGELAPSVTRSRRVCDPAVLGTAVADRR